MTNNIKISQNTMNCINALKQADSVFDLLLDVIEGIYGEIQVDEVMDTEVNDKYFEFRKTIERFLIESVNDSFIP